MRIALFVLLAMAIPAAGCPTDFNFKDVFFPNIAQTIGVLGKFNVIVCSGHERLKLTVAMRQVEPLDALFDVARQAGLQVTRIRHEQGTTTSTYMIGAADQIHASAGKITQTVTLRYASVVHVARTLGERIEGLTGSKVSIDERTNRLVLTGTEEGLAAVSRLLADIDLPLYTADVELAVSAGAPKAQSPLWSGTVRTAQGRVARVEVSTGAPSAKAWQLTRIQGRVTARSNADLFQTVEVNVSATLERRGVTSTVRWSTALQSKDKEEVSAGSIEVAPGEVVTLKVKPSAVLPPPSDRPPVPAAPAAPACQSDELDIDLDCSPPATAPPPPGGGDLDLEGI